MDNQIFNVNGDNDDDLALALKLVFGNMQSCEGWFETKQHGLILLWHCGDSETRGTRLPTPFTSDDCLPFIRKWLVSDFAKTVELADWCHDMGHDGHNTEGWYVYVEDWGHVADSYYAICGIKPSYAWHGK